jgi:hypothetical protein
MLHLDVNLSTDLFKNQISKLVITIDTDRNHKHYSAMNYICNNIFHVFKKLSHLIFFESSHRNIVEFPFIDLPMNFSSSTLLVLNVKITNFDTCLSLVDGRFNQLQTLIVEAEGIWSSRNLDNKVSFDSKKIY